MLKFGIDVVREDPSLLSNFGNIGVITNQACTDSSGVNVVQVLYNAIQKAPGATLVQVFGPQHGYMQTEQDNMIETPDSTFTVYADGKQQQQQQQPVTVPLASLYGQSREPRQTDIDGIDTLIVDLQDVGCRVYTFMYTMALCIRALAKNTSKPGRRLVILDRPNPLGLCNMDQKQQQQQHVSGDVMEQSLTTSFVGLYPLPLRYGLTMGELCNYFYRLEASPKNVTIIVVKVPGLTRNLTVQEVYAKYYAGYHFMPSPNLNSVECARIYMATVLLEATNVSEGRGTTLPFHIYGTPWFQPVLFRRFYRLAEDCTALGKMTGITHTEHQFRPTFGKFQGQICQGMRVWMDSQQDTVTAFTYGILILLHCAIRYSDKFAWRPLELGYEYNFTDWAINLVLGHQKWKTLVDTLQAKAAKLDPLTEEAGFVALETEALQLLVTQLQETNTKTRTFMQTTATDWLYPATADRKSVV